MSETGEVICNAAGRCKIKRCDENVPHQPHRVWEGHDDLCTDTGHRCRALKDGSEAQCIPVEENHEPK